MKSTRARSVIPGAGSLVIHLQSDSPEHLLTLAEATDERLSRDAVSAVGVQQSLSIAALVPAPEDVRRRRDRVKELNAPRIIADLRAALIDNGFEPSAFERYIEALRQAIDDPPVPGLDTLTRFPGMSGSLLPKSVFGEDRAPPTQALTIVFLKQAFTDRGQRDAAVRAVRSALSDLPGATLTGLSVVGYDIESSVRRDLPRLMAVAGVLVLGVLAAGLRRSARVLLAVTPAMVGAAFLAAAMAGLGVRFNLINLVALPLLAGITVDYGIFLVGAAQRYSSPGNDPGTSFSDFAAAAHAVGISATTTLLGFGSLVFTHTPAMRSLGVMLGASILGALVGTYLIALPGLFLKRPALG